MGEYRLDLYHHLGLRGQERDQHHGEIRPCVLYHGSVLCHRTGQHPPQTPGNGKKGTLPLCRTVSMAGHGTVGRHPYQKCDSEPYQYHILSGPDHRGHRYRTLHPEGAPPVRAYCSGLRCDGTDDGTDVFWQLGRTQPDLLLRSLHTGAELCTYHRLRCLLHLSGSPGNRCRRHFRRDTDYVHPPDRCTLLSGHQQRTGRRGTPPI